MNPKDDWPLLLASTVVALFIAPSVQEKLFRITRIAERHSVHLSISPRFERVYILTIGLVIAGSAVSSTLLSIISLEPEWQDALAGFAEVSLFIAFSHSFLVGFTLAYSIQQILFDLVIPTKWISTALVAVLCGGELTVQLYRTHFVYSPWWIWFVEYSALSLIVGILYRRRPSLPSDATFLCHVLWVFGLVVVLIGQIAP